MEGNEQIFQANNSDLWTWALLCLGAAILLLVLAIWLSKEKSPDPRRRVLLPMLFFFGALLAFMGAAGNLFSLTKYPSLAVSATQIRLDDVVFPFPRKDAVRIEKMSGGLGGERLILFLQTPEGKTYAFPDERYPVQAIWQALKKEP